jgi:hypothetical protein
VETDLGTYRRSSSVNLLLVCTNALLSYALYNHIKDISVCLNQKDECLRCVYKRIVSLQVTVHGTLCYKMIGGQRMLAEFH